MKYLLVAISCLAVLGCTSFRTKSLYRFPNDSLTVQQTNRKLKGLPVKLKVPSHVLVSVCEQQVILANSETEKQAKDAAKEKTSAAVTAQENLIENLQEAVVAAEATLNSLKENETKLQTLMDAHPNDKAYEQAFKNNTKARAKAQNVYFEALKDKAREPQEQEKLRVLRAQAELAERDASVKYSFLAFDPPQFEVKTTLQYTDKIFLVDFKRPAGGVLDLKEASFDEQQYFSKIQAEVEERTLADISSALQTVQGPLSNAFSREDGNVAVPTSAGTSDAESNSTVDFQESVVATQRFDISEPGWEQRLQDFVNHHLGIDSVAVQDLPIETYHPLPGPLMAP